MLVEAYVINVTVQLGALFSFSFDSCQRQAGYEEAIPAARVSPEIRAPMSHLPPPFFFFWGGRGGSVSHVAEGKVTVLCE